MRALAAALLSLCLSGCGATMQCKRAAIVVTSHPSKPRPAGVVRVDCDGKLVAEIVAGEVQ